MNIKALENYELVQQKNLKDLKSEGYYLRHIKSGAKILLTRATALWIRAILVFFIVFPFVY